MTNFVYFVAGYLVIFGLIGAYILHLVALRKRLERERKELSAHN
jgi:CcmD family protein